MHSPSYVHANYLGDLVRTDDLRSNIKAVCDALQAFDFDAVAFTGVSGMLLGPSIAMQMNKTMLVVRKEVAIDVCDPNAYCHSSLYVEGDYGARRYVVVDDLTCTGKTFNMIQRRIKAALPEAQCIGMRTVWDVTRGRPGMPSLHPPMDGL